MGEKILIKTGHSTFDNLIPQIKAFLEQDSLDVVIDGKPIRGYRSPYAKSLWIRDFSDILRGMKYFEKDLKSTVEHFAETQAANGSIFDYFTTSPEKLPCERENWTKYVRVPVEADVEYRFVKAAYLAWQATGDDPWIQNLLPHMERALHYVLSHPWRWDEATGLVKRVYTIDTWYFPDGRPCTAEESTSPDASPTDGWGSSAMLYALIEGLAGIEDNQKLFRKCRISPRWHAAGINEAEIHVCYESSGMNISYSICYEKHQIHLGVQTAGADCQFHILLPGKLEAKATSVKGKNVEFTNQKIRNTNYVDLEHRIEGKISLVIDLEE